jgi:N-acyl homoserine lactone hydrolase
MSPVPAPISAKRITTAFVACVAIAMGAFTIHAQPAVTAPRLYVMDCGIITNTDPAPYGLAGEKVIWDMAVPCYLIVHPKGTLLYDTGLGDNDSKYTAANRPPRYTPGSRSLKTQLAEIGYTPDKITYLALSHSHQDHTGNSQDYAASTWLVQQAEYDIMFTEKANTANYALLKDAKKVMLKGDHDVFGDGTVILKHTPGHTPGHQVLYVKLTKTGGVVLTGDLYHWLAEHTLDRMSPREREAGQTKASRDALDEFMKKNKAQLWVGHDLLEFSKRDRSPKFYE